MQMVRVRALKPFVGSYPCQDAGVADHISTVLDWNDQGQLVTKRVAYKKVFMEVGYDRPASPADLEDDKERARIAEATGTQFNSRLSSDKSSIHIEANPPYLELPADYAEKLADQGLVEIEGIEEGKIKKRSVSK